MPAKAESVAEGGINFLFLRLIKSEIEFGIKRGIIREMVDGRRYDIFFDCQYRSNGLHSASGTKQMADHGFCGADVELIGMVAKNP